MNFLSVFSHSRIVTAFNFFLMMPSLFRSFMDYGHGLILTLFSQYLQVVILDSGCQVRQDGLKALAKALTRNAVAKNIQVDELTIIDITVLYHICNSGQSNVVYHIFQELFVSIGQHKVSVVSLMYS
jgi:hypothetical protein